MADEFDRFLAHALAPAPREPDRGFVARVQAGVLLEELFAAQRRSLARDLMQQLVALLAVSAGAWWLETAAPVANWAAESPAAALAILFAAFMFLAVLFTWRTGAGNVGEWQI